MIAPATPDQTDALVALAERTGVFKPHEIVALREVLDDYHAANADYGHAAAVLIESGTPAGFAYLAPTAMTDRTWELWWIAVDPARQGTGLGRRLLAWAESHAVAQTARLLLIETSTTPAYEPTRLFYLRAGYVHWATLPDFYADGDGKAVFGKRLSAG